MSCWPVYVVGGFFISLLIVDMYQYSWDQLPYHAGLGIFFTGLYYTFCLLFGNEISIAVLFVPLIFVLMFFLSSWLLYNNIKANNCCMTCGQKDTDTGSATGSSTSTPTAQPPPTNAFADFWNWIITDQMPKPKPKAKCST